MNYQSLIGNSDNSREEKKDSNDKKRRAELSIDENKRNYGYMGLENNDTS